MRATIALLCLLSTGALAAPASITRAEFGAVALEAAKTSQDGPCEYVEAAHQVRCGDGWELNLDNLWQEYQAAAPADRPARLEILRQTAASDGTELLDKPTAAQLRPQVKSRYELTSYPLIGRVRGATVATADWIPLGGDLAVDLVLDTPTSMLTATPEVLKELGLTNAEARVRALANLREASPKRSFQSLGDGVWAARVGDSYDSSRVLLTQELARLPLKGEAVVVVANRGNVLVAGSEDPSGLAHLAGLAEQGMQQPRWITGAALVYRDGVAHAWLPPAGHPSHAAFRYLAVGSRAELYRQQKELLEAVFEVEGVTVAVPAVGAIGDLRAAGVTLAILEDLDNLVPQTDLVAFLVPDGEPALVRWADFVGIAVPTPRPGLFPPRYDLSKAQLDAHRAALAAKSVDLAELKGL